MTNKKTDKTKDKKHSGEGKTPPSFGYIEKDKSERGKPTNSNP